MRKKKSGQGGNIRGRDKATERGPKGEKSYKREYSRGQRGNPPQEVRTKTPGKDVSDRGEKKEKRKKQSGLLTHPWVGKDSPKNKGRRRAGGGKETPHTHNVLLPIVMVPHQGDGRKGEEGVTFRPTRPQHQIKWGRDEKVEALTSDVHSGQVHGKNLSKEEKATLPPYLVESSTNNWKEKYIKNKKIETDATDPGSHSRGEDKGKREMGKVTERGGTRVSRRRVVRLGRPRGKEKSGRTSI